MNKYEYLKHAIENRLYCDRRWLLRVCSIRPEGDPKHDFPTLVDGKIVVVINNEDVVIDDADATLPLFGFLESVTLEKGLFPAIDKETKTTYRTVLLNLIVVKESVGDKFGYIREFDPNSFTNMVRTALVDTSISISEYLRIHELLGFTSCLMPFSVPGASKLLLTSSPKAKQLRDQLIKQYAGQLEDPIILAKIDKALGDFFWEEIKGDPSEGFMISAKTINKVRKMTHGMIGGAARLDDQGKMMTITKSLSEGWGPEDMPVVANTNRAASYLRGKETQNGGAEAKFSGLVFQNDRISEDDCGDTLGTLKRITPLNYTRFDGYYKVNGKDKYTLAELKGLIGEKAVIRTFASCKTKNGNFCKKCAGERLASSNVGITPRFMAVPNVFMSTAMGAFHGKVIQSIEYDYQYAFS